MNYKEFKDYKNIEKVALKNNCEIREGKGSHKVIKAPNGSTMVYYKSKDISDGVAHKIYKFFKMLGFITIVLIIYNWDMVLDVLKTLFN